MEIHDNSLGGIPVINGAQTNSLSAESLAVRILQMIGIGVSDSPNIWALGGCVVAIVATVASIVTGARMVRLRLQPRTEQEGFCHGELSISLPFPQSSFDKKKGIGFPSFSSNLITAQEMQEERREKNKKKKAIGLENSTDISAKRTQGDLFIARQSENWATARGHEISLWEGDARMMVQEDTRRKPSGFYPEYFALDDRKPMPAFFRPFLESLSKIEEFSQFEREEIMNMNFKDAWEKGKSKLRRWQQENLPSFAVRGHSNSLFAKEDVVKFWDNLKGRALKTFYVPQGFASALDSGWMSGIASLGTTSNGILTPWDHDRGTSLRKMLECRPQIKGLCMDSSNTIITGCPIDASGRTALKLWDTRMGTRPAVVSGSDFLIQRNIFDIKPGGLHKLYVRHDKKTVSIHELRMLGEGPISTMSLEGPDITAEGQHDLLSDCSFAEAVTEAEDRTWWDDDAVVVSNDEESVCDEDDESYAAADSGSSYGSSTKSVVSWCLGAVRSISSSLAK
eukprot:Gb_01321 [translate_table: standard]